MAHPFFDSSAYPWWIKPAAEDFRRTLSVLYPQPGRIDPIYKAHGPDLLPLNLGQSPYDIWKDALENLARSGYLKSFCEARRADFEKVAANAQLMQSIFDAADPVKTVVFSSGEIVMNRKNLRTHLGGLEAKQAKKCVVLIRGAPFSGKSWGRHIFFEMANALGVAPIYLGDGIVGTVEDVVKTIWAAFELPAKDKIPEKRTTEDAWYREICIQFRELAGVAKKTMWIAVDDLGAGLNGVPLLDPRIKDFFDQFVLQMGNPDFRQWFRLLLIHYPEGSVPTRWKKEYWVEDRVSEADLQKEDVVEVMKEWARQNQRTTVDDQMQTLAAAAVAAADHPGQDDTRPRLQRLYDTVMASLQKL